MQPLKETLAWGSRSASQVPSGVSCLGDREGVCVVSEGGLGGRSACSHPDKHGRPTSPGLLWVAGQRHQDPEGRMG